MRLDRPPDLPSALEQRYEHVAARLAELAVALPPALEAAAAKVLLASDFVLRVLLRWPEALVDRLGDARPLEKAATEGRLDLAGRTEAQAMTALRRTRQIEMARLAWRDIAGTADVDATLREVSLLAECGVQAALAYATTSLEPRFGRPRDAAGNELPLLVLGMGKLGGNELNFSSDVDLVFLYPDGVQLRSSVEPETYYLRLAQLLIKLLDQRTEDGFAYRVDTRLRPFGASGPLCVSLAALEGYLVEHGRDWERYAYVKARLLTGEQFAPELFDLVLAPFVYRRYLDYGVFDALRQMKRLIAEEVARKDMADNIKLGPGGIREIEFIAQAFQIVRGGRRPELRARSLLEVLPLLAGDRQLTDSTVSALAGAYRYLRAVENRLQAFADEQTHELPREDEARAILAYSLGEPSWAAFEARLARQRAIVETEFERVAWEAKRRRAASGRPGRERLGHGRRGGDVERHDACRRRACRRAAQRLAPRWSLPAHGRGWPPALAAVLTRTIAALTKRPAALRALERVLPVFRAVARRSAYLALLNENPAALERLLKLVGDSSWLARQIAEQPLLLDELLDNRVFDSPPSREELAALLESATQGRRRRRRGAHARRDPGVPAHSDLSRCGGRSARFVAAHEGERST